MSLPHHHTHTDKTIVHIGTHSFTATQHRTRCLPALEKPHLEWFALLLPVLGCHCLARREHLLVSDPISLHQGTPVQMLQIHSIHEVFMVLLVALGCFSVQAPIVIFKSYLFQRDTVECQQTSSQWPCSVLKVPLKCIQTSTICMNVFSLRTRPCSWPLTWTLRAPVPPKCVVSPLQSGLLYHVTVFRSILTTTHMQSQYWVPGSPTQAMMTSQHQNVTCGT